MIGLVGFLATGAIVENGDKPHRGNSGHIRSPDLAGDEDAVCDTDRCHESGLSQGSAGQVGQGQMPLP